MKRMMRLSPACVETGSGGKLAYKQNEACLSLDYLPADVIEQVISFLNVRDVLALASTCRALRHVAMTPKVWADLVMRSFLYEELPQDLSFLKSRSTCCLRSQFRQLSLQRPAFLSDAPRTSEIIDHTGSRFRKVLHIDGRRDLNFTTVLRSVPPGHYNVVWRLMLQPGYIRGYCNFRAVFSRPADAKAAAKAQAKARARATTVAPSAAEPKLTQLLPPGLRRLQARGAGADASSMGIEQGVGLRLGRFAAGTEMHQGLATRPQAKRRPRTSLRWLPSGCMFGGHSGVAPRGRGQRDLEEDEEDEDALAARVAAEVAAAEEEAEEQERAGGVASGAGGVHAYMEAVPAVHVDGVEAEPRGLQTQQSGGWESVVQRLTATPATVLSVQRPVTAGPQIPAPTTQSQQELRPALPQLEIAQQQQLQPQQHNLEDTPQLPHYPEGLGHPEIEPLVQPQLHQQDPSQPTGLAQGMQRQGSGALATGAATGTPRLQRGSASHLRAQPAAGPQQQPLGPAPQQQQQPHAQQLQRAMGQLATVSAKRDAALASAGGTRYVPRWLSPLWGSHACTWRQLDPAGPLGRGAWRTVHMGTLTVRRRADVHLHGVMVQLRPTNAEQQQLALPPGETRWRGALVDFVELVPARKGGLLEGLVPSFRPSVSPLGPEQADIVILPKV